MGASKVIDAFVAYQFIKILSTPWDKTKAFELDIIDKNGKLLKKTRDLTTREEKRAYTMIHRLVWNIKRLLDKLPPTKTRIGSFATALWMLKESTETVYGCDFNLSHKAFKNYLKENYKYSGEMLTEVTHNDTKLYPGEYIITNAIDVPGTDVRRGDTFNVSYTQDADEEFAGEYMFLVTNNRTRDQIIVSHEDIELNESRSFIEYSLNPSSRDIAKLMHNTQRVIRFMGNEDEIYVWDAMNKSHNAMKIQLSKNDFNFYGRAEVTKTGLLMDIFHIASISYEGNTDYEGIRNFLVSARENNLPMINGIIIPEEDISDDYEDDGEY